MTHSSACIEMIPIADIAVANPRVRNAKTARQRLRRSPPLQRQPQLQNLNS